MAEEAPRPARLMESLADWAKSIAIAFVLFLCVRATVVEAFKIPTASMEGTLLVGDFLLVNKAVYGPRIPGTNITLTPFAEPARGEVIVFHPPHEPEKNYVKRLVGLPEDTLEMRDKRLYLNGAPVYEPYARYADARGDAAHPDMEWQSTHLIASQPKRYHPTRDNWGPIVVPFGGYFVLGDNRDNSEDSRYWGFVSRDQIRGRPWLVYYSQRPPPTAAMPWLSRVRWSRLGTVIS
ncbi:MAG: signal peptidase I [Gemmatimonadetes bacterium]|nr:signal peptidase I [Gemmatimonadota bacterium]MDA1104061.1 signal peptidase I [Gemmatimonadota bacterium]